VGKIFCRVFSPAGAALLLTGGEAQRNLRAKTLLALLISPAGTALYQRHFGSLVPAGLKERVAFVAEFYVHFQIFFLKKAYERRKF
jgi:hypothetical protein